MTFINPTLCGQRQSAWFSSSILLVAVALLAGCQSIQSSPLVKNARTIGRSTNDEGPAKKRKPFSLDSITGTKAARPAAQPPTRPQSLATRETPPSLVNNARGDESLQNKKSPLNLENVGLAGIGDSAVHVEAGDIEDVAKSAQDQLPSFVEAAVHPFKNDTSRVTLSDQSNSQATSSLGDSMSPNDPTGNRGSQSVQLSLSDVTAQAHANNSMAQHSQPLQQTPQQSQSTNEVKIVSAQDMLAQQQPSRQQPPKRIPISDATLLSQTPLAAQPIVAPQTANPRPPKYVFQQPQQMVAQTQHTPATQVVAPPVFAPQQVASPPASTAPLTSIANSTPATQPTAPTGQAATREYVLAKPEYPANAKPATKQPSNSPEAVTTPIQSVALQSTSQDHVMKIVADSSGQRPDGLSANVARLFANQQQPASSPIPGSQAETTVQSQPATGQVQQVSYEIQTDVQANLQTDSQIESVAPANYTFSDAANHVNRIEANTATVINNTENAATLLAPAAAPMVRNNTPRPAKRIADSNLLSSTLVSSNSPATSDASGSSTSWHQPLDVAIRQLDSQLAKTADANAELEQRIRLHLMKMVAGERVSGQLDLSDIAPARRQFWQHQIRALEILLNKDHPQGITALASQRRRATMAAEQLAIASDHLANDSGMRLLNCAFSSEVLGFGQIRRAVGPYQPGQQLLIYCEIENYSLRNAKTSASVDSQPMVEAELKGMYSIVDKDNRVVHQLEYQPVKDVAMRRRNDFYIFFPVTLPQLKPGQYQLHLSVEDRVGQKVAGSGNDLSFEVAPAERTARGMNQQQPASVPVYRRR